ncbi:2'-5' RNA ligase family protein [Curtobacterium sp. RRHDQ66]|uniref:2'-5' RNA ligase family protein n=1 Tax=Curtobacterium guangdongense TaxID=3413380 RepID=UPI003BF15F3A
MDRLVVVGTPERLPGTVDRSNWPVHVTVLPNFVVDGPTVAAVTSIVREAADRQSAFDVDLGPRAMFGPGRDVPVLLAEHPVFHALHGSLSGSVESLSGFVPDHADYWGGGYRPHATVVSGAESADGRQLSVTNLAVVSLTGPRARMLRNYPLAARS